MISPKEVRSKAEKWWPYILQGCVTGLEFFPKEIPQIGAFKQEDMVSNFLTISKQFDDLLKESKENKGYGYCLDWEERNFRNIGKNRFIKRIYFNTKTDYLKYLGKEKEFQQFNLLVNKILLQFAELKDWIIQYPLKVLENEKWWDDLIKVLLYFKNDHLPDRYYIRELPIRVHTKFIEERKHLLYELLNIVLPSIIIRKEFTGVKDFEKRFALKYAEAQIRIRLLDLSLAQKAFSGMTDISLTETEFNQLHLPCSRVFILENKTNYSNIINFLTLPEVKNSIAIFGSGFKVGLLKNATWLHSKELLYWGDLDVQGFQILSQLRSYFPQVKSFLMDWNTFNSHLSESGPGTESNIKALDNLAEEELGLFEYLQKENLRLEQEKIRHDFVLEWMKKMAVKR